MERSNFYLSMPDLPLLRAEENPRIDGESVVGYPQVVR